MQPVHHVVGAPAEVVVQPRVLGVQPVIAVGGRLVGPVDAVAPAAHHGSGRPHVRVGAGRDRGVDGRAERGRLGAGGRVHRHPQHVGVRLHQERVPQQAAGRDELGHRDAAGAEGLDDLPGAERGRLDQRPVDLLRPGGQGQADDQAGEAVIDKHRPVARLPVERDQAVRADRLNLGQRGQVLLDRPPGPLGLGPVAVGDEVLREPAEDVADPGLARLVPVQPADDPAVDDAAHARDLGQRLGVHHVTGRGAHDREHLPRLDRPGGGRGHVRVDVADGDRDPGGQAGPGRRLGGEGSRGLAELADPVRELALGEAGEVGVERGQELAARVAPVLVDPLVAGRARVADVGPCQLPDDPVGRLDPVVHPVVELGVLLEQLQPLRELPLGRDQPAVARPPALRPFGRERVDPVRLRLGGVVLPQLHVGVRAVLVLEHLAQRRPVGEDRQDRAGGEVGADPDNVGRVDARRQDRLGDRLP